MPHVITQNCCNDAACVPVCPVECIRPTPDDPNYGTTEMLYIDPDVCIDCGVCVDVCPVGAIVADTDLTPEMARFEQINADYFAATGSAADIDAPEGAPSRTASHTGDEPLRVAVIGAGAAGHYTAEALLSRTDVDVRVDMFERLCTPGGLVRFGVAPDHQKTKQVQESFARTMGRDWLRVFFDVEVGRDITHAELLRRYHAVVYAVGAVDGRQLGIPGEDLANSASASEFVAWFNGHPDFADRTFDLSHETVVVIGNGNVALDVARVLTSDPEDLANTDIADHALDALRNSKVREVVICARRGPADAAFTSPELLGLSSGTGIDVVVDPEQLDALALDDLPSAHHQFGRDLKLSILRELASAPAHSERRVSLRFFTSPQEIVGDTRVEGIRLLHRNIGRGASGEHTETLLCGMVLRAVGYRGTAIPGVPFDDARGVIPNDAGRVLDPADGTPVAGTYTTGWIKRGPSGVIGTNKRCANETVDSILDDFAHGRLRTPPDTLDGLDELLPVTFGFTGAQAIDEHELAAGRRSGRPRVKVVDHGELRAIGRSAVPAR